MLLRDEISQSDRIINVSPLPLTQGINNATFLVYKDAYAPDHNPHQLTVVRPLGDETHQRGYGQGGPRMLSAICLLPSSNQRTLIALVSHVPHAQDYCVSGTSANDALRGALLPKIRDLIRDCPFFQNDMTADATAYVDGLLNRLAPPDDPIELFAALETMLAAPGQQTFFEAAGTFEAAARAAPDRLKRVGSVRFHLYAALSGHQASVSKVAAHAVEVAYSGALAPATALAKLVSAVVQARELEYARH